MNVFAFLLVGFLIIYSAWGYYFIWSMMRGVPYYPSHKNDIKKIIEYLPKDKTKKIVELGAGDGRLAFAMAKAGYKVTAIEYNSFLSLLMRLIKLIKRIDNVEIKNKNFFDEDLTQYDVYVGYLFPKSMEKLYPIIFQQANKGKVVISNTFKLKNCEPVSFNEKIYLYKV
jgi:predicted RNA methylase